MPAAVGQVRRNVVTFAGKAQIVECDVEAVLPPFLGGAVQSLLIGTGIQKDFGDQPAAVGAERGDVVQ